MVAGKKKFMLNEFCQKDFNRFSSQEHLLRSQAF